MLYSHVEQRVSIASRSWDDLSGIEYVFQAEESFVVRAVCSVQRVGRKEFALKVKRERTLVKFVADEEQFAYVVLLGIRCI